MFAQAFGQERIAKTLAGPNGDQFRVAVTFIAASEDSYKLQSLIVDIDRVKDKTQEPTKFYVDLTTTVRSLTTGEKKQRIFVIRWERSADIEVKCEGGKWFKQKPGPEIDKIVEAVKAVIQSSPLDSKKATEIDLPKGVEEKVTAILTTLETSTANCVRGGAN